MVRVRGRTGASWRGMRLPQRLQEGLRQRHALRLHGWCIGSLILGVMWAVSHAQMALGVPSLALRYLVTLGVGYGVYLLVLRLWAAWLLRRRSDTGDAPDGLDLLPDAGWPAGPGPQPGPTIGGSHHFMCLPPSTLNVAPLTKLAPCDSRKSTTSAISLG